MKSRIVCKRKCMQKQNIVNKRIELEDIQKVIKILLRREEDLASKAK